MVTTITNKFQEWFITSNRAERIWLMAKIEFQLKYYENKLGLIWALIKPITDIFKFYLIFEVMFDSGIDNFLIYVFTGLMVWNFFTEMTSGTVRVLSTKKYLYEYTNMSKIEIYFAYSITAFLGFMFNFAIFLVAALFYGIYPSFSYIFFLLIFLNVYVLSLGISLIISNLFLLFKDMTQIWGIIVTYGFFLSPILFRGELFARELPLLIYINPISGIINNSRAVLLNASPPDWNMLMFDMAYASVLLIIGVILLNRLSPRASELISICPIVKL